MALRKRVLQFDESDEIKKEWESQIDQAWKILCRTGSVCVTDLKKSGEMNIKDILKKDPAAFTRAHCDYNSYDDIPYDVFVKQILEDEK